MARQYELDFKLMIVELLETGRKVSELSKEYGIDESVIRRWRKRYDSNLQTFTTGKREVSDSEKRIKELEKALIDAQLERDILKKAISIFSKSDKKDISL